MNKRECINTPVIGRINTLWPSLTRHKQGFTVSMRKNPMLRIGCIIFALSTAFLICNESAYAGFVLGTPVQTAFGAGPCISSDGLTLYSWFIGPSFPNSTNNEDVLVSTRHTTSNSWDNERYIGWPANSYAADRDPDITADGLTLYLASNRSGLGAHDLWVTTRQTIGGAWTDPVNLGPTVNSSSAEFGPNISADGCTLYFSSGRPNGSGDLDLWVATRETPGDDWDEPVNLGPNINSASDDSSPSISADGCTLFFDSDRPGGLGSVDIWMSRRATTSDPWDEPVNLGSNINTSYSDRDPYISLDGSVLCFTNVNPTEGYWKVWEAPITFVIDFDDNGFVDFNDFSKLAENWLGNNLLTDISPSPLGDGVVDIKDLRVLAAYWLKNIHLIANWKFNEIEDNIASDSVGTHDGILHGNPVWKPDDGMLDGALEFDGNGDYVLVDYILNPRSGPFSAFAWIKSNKPGRAIISQTDGTGLGSTWLGASPSSGRLMTNLMYAEMESTAIITDNLWHHVGIVWDGKRRSLYVDGIEVAKDTNDRQGVFSTGNLYIGADKTLSAGSFWDGFIDDVRIYNSTVQP